MSTRPVPVKILPAFLLMLSFCAPSPPLSKEVSGRTFFTAANIWYEIPEKILSTNYHLGTILPVGTKVEVDEVTSGEIRFRSEHGQDFKFIFIKKHSSAETEISDYFHMYFSTENPLREGGPYQKFSDKEKKNIEKGTIEVGMSKEAVLMSYGYPPTHKTPSLEGDIWVYWTSRFANSAVHFVNGRVTRSNL